MRRGKADEGAAPARAGHEGRPAGRGAQRHQLYFAVAITVRSVPNTQTFADWQPLM
ncbi:hypothetical protein LMG29660_03762 [Burkholderia puraquae]|uniref:Uncharacterized protein n=1 Tax=Burkholderia puraquae TaxID=1904757 RepID=A0A6J5DZZ0_9BURK|nr:hypothetical protein LMG29660_03762 [Burkholderia puraquae]